MRYLYKMINFISVIKLVIYFTCIQLHRSLGVYYDASLLFIKHVFIYAYRWIDESNTC